MFPEWIVGLFAALVATPVAVASYLSIYRVAPDERRAPHSVRAPHHATALKQAEVGHHRHYHRHLAA